MTLRYLIAKALLKAHLPAIRDSTLHHKTWIGSGTHITGSRIAKHTYVGNFNTIIDTQIGAFCSIADDCIIGGASHPVSWASTSPVFHNGHNVLRTNFAEHAFATTSTTYIGSDVWIGSRCLVKGGVRIGDGAVLGMGSVLTKDVGQFEIWAGNPARFIRRRFDTNTASALSASHWWDLGDEALRSLAPYFTDVEALIQHLKDTTHAEE